MGGDLLALRAALTSVNLVQVIHVTGAESAAVAAAAAPAVDALLLDSGQPASVESRSLGGTGRTHDWAISREIVAAAPCPVFLAGGLNADNVAGAVRTVRPDGVDACNGVRTGGFLDRAKLAAFVEVARGA